MNDFREPVGQLDIMALADGRLDPVRRREVEQHLGARPDIAAFARDVANQNEAIRRIYSPVLGENIPFHIRSAIERPARGRMHRWPIAASIAAALLLSMTGGWFGGRYAQNLDPDVIRYVEAAGAEHENAAGASVLAGGSIPAVDTVAPLDWLSGELPLKLRVPDLSAEGYRPEGESLVEVAGQPSARLSFRDETGKRLSLFLRSRWSETSAPLNVESHGTTRSVYWAEGPLLWVLVGELEESRMKELAETVRSEMEPQPDDHTVPIAELPPMIDDAGLTEIDPATPTLQ